MVVFKKSEKSSCLRTQSSTKHELRNFHSRLDPMLGLTLARDVLISSYKKLVVKMNEKHLLK